MQVISLRTFTKEYLRILPPPAEGIQIISRTKRPFYIYPKKMQPEKQFVDSIANQIIDILHGQFNEKFEEEIPIMPHYVQDMTFDPQKLPFGVTDMFGKDPYLEPRDPEPEPEIITREEDLPDILRAPIKTPTIAPVSSGVEIKKVRCEGDKFFTWEKPCWHRGNPVAIASKVDGDPMPDDWKVFHLCSIHRGMVEKIGEYEVEEA